MKRYEHEASRPVVSGRTMEYMCPADTDTCHCVEDVVEDGIVRCGKPAVVIRVHRTMDIGYSPQCMRCYYQTRRRSDPTITELRNKWGKKRVEVPNGRAESVGGAINR